MGEVYRAQDTRLGREVAIKLLPPEVSADSDRLKRFEKEAQAASSLNHPNIVTIYEVERIDSTSFIVMELVEGRTLREVLAEGALPLRKLLNVAVQIGEGLAKAHAAGIVHRDLKPENVMVTKDGLVKILDFGLAKLARPDQDGGQETQGPTVSAGTTPGIVMGTVAYMSPEQASGHPMDFRSDQFSFGSILYEMATGRQAFRRSTGAQTMAAIIQEDPESIAAINPRVPAPLRWIVDQCLAKEPRERYASTEDLARELARVRDHLSEASIPVTTFELSARRRFRPGIALAAALAVIVAVGAFVAGTRSVVRSPLSFERVTFRRGTIGEARFASDGVTIVYDAAWDGNPPELFTTRRGASESRSFGFGSASLRAVSDQGEMAILLRPTTAAVSLGGTLARASLAGGEPRPVLENVQFADWSPGGRELAIVREVRSRRRLEFPPGKVLYEVPHSAKLFLARISPQGDRIAFEEGPDTNSIDGAIAVVDLSGKKTTLTPLFGSLSGLAWAPTGREIWFSAPLSTGKGGGVYAVTLSGKRRLLYPSSRNLRVSDISPDDSLLAYSIYAHYGVSCLAPGDRNERDLSWLDWSRAMDLSADGKTLLFSEEGQGGGPRGSVYIRRTDGSPAVRLGEGYGTALSNDGKWVFTIPQEEDHIRIVPTGPGDARVIRYPGTRSILAVRPLPDDRRLLLLASEKSGARLFVGDMDGKELRAISEEGVRGVNFAVSPSGDLAAAIGPDNVPRLYPTSGGSARPAPGLEPGDIPLRFSMDGRHLFVARMLPSSAMVERVDLASGRREVWRDLKGSDPAGYSPSTAIQITPDGRYYAYTYRRFLNDLYLVSGLK
jgi:Tol biopolymer transport system component